jgi:hypothetical protein
MAIWYLLAAQISNRWIIPVKVRPDIGASLAADKPRQRYRST